MGTREVHPEKIHFEGNLCYRWLLSDNLINQDDDFINEESGMRSKYQLAKVMALVLLFILMVAVQACERRDPNLIGVWESGGERAEFFEDGTLRMRRSTPTPLSFVGKYKLTGENSISLDMKAEGKQGGINVNMILKYEINGDRFILKHPESGEVTYHRVK